MLTGSNHLYAACYAALPIMRMRRASTCLRAGRLGRISAWGTSGSDYLVIACAPKTCNVISGGDTIWIFTKRNVISLMETVSDEFWKR